MQSRRSQEASGEPLTEPEEAHLREEVETEQYETEEDESEDEELEATELQHFDHARSRPPRSSRVLSPGTPQTHWYDPAKRFWRHEIRISVPHVDCRDHLANERTFLGYLRTSVGLSMLGTVIAQLYRLQHAPHPSQVFGYYVLSKPLSVIFQASALAMVLLGGIRFWRQQSAMAVGKVHAGGWEMLTIAVGSFLLLLMMFAVHVGIDIYKDDTPDDPTRYMHFRQ